MKQAVLYADYGYILFHKGDIELSKKGSGFSQVCGYNNMYVDVVYEIHVSNYSKPEVEATVKAPMMLLSNLLKKMSNTSDDSLGALKAAVSLVLYVMHSHAKTESASHSFDEAMLTMLGLVSMWVAKLFQHPFQIQTQHETTYKTKEMKVCRIVFVTFR